MTRRARNSKSNRELQGERGRNDQGRRGGVGHESMNKSERCEERARLVVHPGGPMGGARVGKQERPKRDEGAEGQIDRNEHH